MLPSEVLERLTEIVAEHPDGVTSSEVTTLLFGELLPYEFSIRRSYVCSKLRKLEKWEKVTALVSSHQGNVWVPVSQEV